MSSQSADEYQRQVAEIIERRLRGFTQWARDVIAHSRADQAAFEARLQVRWQEAFDLFEIVYVEAQCLGHEFNEEQRPLAAAEHDLVFDALVTLHARASLLVSEVYALLRSGHPVGAMARWRSMHEVQVVAQIIRENDVALAERFLLHEHVERWLAARSYQEHAVTLGEELLEPTYLEQLERTVKDLCAKFGDSNYAKPNGWANELLKDLLVKKRKRSPSLQDLAAHAKLDFMRPYYSLASEGIHPDFKGLRRTVYTMGEDIMLAGPTNYGFADPAQLTLWAFYYCTAALVSWKPTSERDARLLILAQLVTNASETFVRVQKELEQEEDEIRLSGHVGGDSN